MHIPGITPDDVTAVRRQICARCEHRRTKPIVGDVCGKCGCNIRGKTRVMRAKCPIGRW